MPAKRLSMRKMVAVGMPVTRHPLHRSVRALLTHTAPILSLYRQIVCLAKDAQLWVVAARLARTDRSAPTPIKARTRICTPINSMRLCP